VADLISKVIGVVALVVAAWWTYANFTVERTHDPTMEVSVAPAVHPLRGDRVLLNVDVFLRNVGKVAIVPRFPERDGDRDLGLEISIVEIEPLGDPKPAVHQASHVEADPEVPWFDWNSGDGNPRLLLLKRNNSVLCPNVFNKLLCFKPFFHRNIINLALQALAIRSQCDHLPSQTHAQLLLLGHVL
jgi:hypothetical protein